MKAFQDFESMEVDTGQTYIFVRYSGSGPGLLLLHGFPETHLMWRFVAPLLAESFTVVCADLRGYGRSGCPESDVNHVPYTKRAMADDMIVVMEKLGFARFFVAGHDRGGRVAYRMALDHPDRVERLAVLDILPTADVWAYADKKFSCTFWPWSLLAQPVPLPEKLLLGAPDAIIDDALGSWGSPAEIFDLDIRGAYVEALSDYAHVHAICEEYRASATLDHDHDISDRSAGRRIGCPVLVLWSGRGALDKWYTTLGGPITIWKKWADDVYGRALNAGHFFPEEIPEETVHVLNQFFGVQALKTRL